jgi:hypothetical protein
VRGEVRPRKRAGKSLSGRTPLAAAAEGSSPEGPERSAGGAQRLDEAGAEAIRDSNDPHETRKGLFHEADFA